MELPGWATTWPLVRQVLGEDRSGRGAAAQSRRSFELTPRTAGADKVVKSICPYCAVGCGQDVYVKDGKVIQIEGDPDSPVSRGRLCPKGSASKQFVTGPGRVQTVKYRRPHGTEWEDCRSRRRWLGAARCRGPVCSCRDDSPHPDEQQLVSTPRLLTQAPVGRADPVPTSSSMRRECPSTGPGASQSTCSPFSTPSR